MSAGPLLGKLAFVTGAGSGIGKATCRLLIRDGAKVIAADKNFQSAIATANELELDFPGFASPLEIDVSSFKSVSDAFKNCVEKHTLAPSVLVNSAGITRDNWLLKMSEADFNDVYNVNLKGTFLMTQQFAKILIENNVPGGSVINLSSIVAKINNVGQANYAATKAGVVSFTKVASKEFGKFNIRVNAVLPGFINTPMITTVPDHIRDHFIEQCPLKRLGDPKEVAEVIAFLASERSSYVNGAAIEVAGGLF